MMLCRRVEVLPIEVDRPRLPRRLRLEGLPANRRRLRHRAAGRACARASDCPSRLHAVDQGRAGRARREHRASTEAARADRRRRSPSASGTSPLALYRYGVAVAEPAGIILADTKFEFGVDPKTGELLLIDEVLTPDSSRFWDAADVRAGPAGRELRQAVRPRLARGAGVGQDARPGRSSRRTSSRGPGHATSRRSSGSPARASIATWRRT